MAQRGVGETTSTASSASATSTIVWSPRKFSALDPSASAGRDVASNPPDLVIAREDALPVALPTPCTLGALVLVGQLNRLPVVLANQATPIFRHDAPLLCPKNAPAE